MGCNPYAEFGIGLGDAFGRPLPPCPSEPLPTMPDDGPVDPLTAGLCDAPLPALDQGISGLAEYLRLAGAGDARLDPRTRAPGSTSAVYFDYLSRRLDALRACRMERTMNGDLARALISTGQLQLGPDAFQSPEARAALAQALQGGSMATPWSLGFVQAPGLATLPFGFSGGAGSSSILFPQAGGNAVGGGGDLFGTVLGGLINVGGNFLLQQQAAKAQEDLLKRQLQLVQAQQQVGLVPQLGTGVLGGMVGGMMEQGAESLLGNLMSGAGNSLMGLLGLGPTGTCGGGPPTVSPSDAAAIYRTGCSGVAAPRGRFYALRANGTRDLFVRVGTVNSVSPRVLDRFARRWAKQAKLSVGKRATRASGRRRPR